MVIGTFGKNPFVPVRFQMVTVRGMWRNPRGDVHCSFSQHIIPRLPKEENQGRAAKEEEYSITLITSREVDGNEAIGQEHESKKGQEQDQSK